MTVAPQTILVVGGSGGIGRAMVSELLHVFPEADITATCFQTEPGLTGPRVQWQRLDVRDVEAIESLAGAFKRVDWIINCVGSLHCDAQGPEKTIRSLEPEFLMANFAVNTVPTLMLAKHFSRALKRSPAPLLATLSARVGSIEDNRLGGWYSYRISKAALNMALKTLSIEWQFSHPKGCVVALHPGTNDTALSRPFQANVPDEKLFSPDCTAGRLLAMLSQLGPGESGKFLAWDGATLPW
jgi:NAD(P)-dependent dehydrogenase (short-subunit alcohol dehydrogenase family)